jgi:hypothetical protein
MVDARLKPRTRSSRHRVAGMAFPGAAAHTALPTTPFARARAVRLERLFQRLPVNTDRELGWRTDFSEQYTLGKLIGKGTFGEVGRPSMTPGM